MSNVHTPVLASRFGRTVDLRPPYAKRGDVLIGFDLPKLAAALKGDPDLELAGTCLGLEWDTHAHQFDGVTCRNITVLGAVLPLKDKTAVLVVDTLARLVEPHRDDEDNTSVISCTRPPTVTSVEFLSLGLQHVYAQYGVTLTADHTFADIREGYLPLDVTLENLTALTDTLGLPAPPLEPANGFKDHTVPEALIPSVTGLDFLTSFMLLQDMTDAAVLMIVADNCR